MRRSVLLLMTKALESLHLYFKIWNEEQRTAPTHPCTAPKIANRDHLGSGNSEYEKGLDLRPKSQQGKESSQTERAVRKPVVKELTFGTKFSAKALEDSLTLSC